MDFPDIATALPLDWYKCLEEDILGRVKFFVNPVTPAEVCSVIASPTEDSQTIKLANEYATFALFLDPTRDTDSFEIAKAALNQAKQLHLSGKC